MDTGLGDGILSCFLAGCIVHHFLAGIAVGWHKRRIGKSVQPQVPRSIKLKVQKQTFSLKYIQALGGPPANSVAKTSLSDQTTYALASISALLTTGAFTAALAYTGGGRLFGIIARCYPHIFVATCK